MDRSRLSLTDALVCLSTPASTNVNGDPAYALFSTWICIWMADSGTSPASTSPSPARAWMPSQDVASCKGAASRAAWQPHADDDRRGLDAAVRAL